MRTKPIKNELTKSLKGEKFYNPNTFNAIDATICYIVILIAFFALGFTAIPVKYVCTKVLKNTVFNDYFFMMIVMSFISQGAIAGVAAIFYRVKRVNAFSGGGYNFNTNFTDAVSAVILVLGVGLCFSPLHTEFFEYMTAVFGDLGLEIPESVIEKSNPVFVYFYGAVVVPVFPAVCEELLFRGVIMRGMSERGLFYGAITSSLMFAFMHGSVGMIILQFLVGLTIAAVVMITKNHIYGSIMHCAYNLLLSVLSALPDIAGEIAEDASGMTGGAMIIIGVIFLITGGLYYINKYFKKRENEIKGIKTEPSKFEKVPLICYSTINESDLCVKLPYYTDDKDIRSRKDTLFFYRNGFVPYNKNSIGILPTVLFIVGMIAAIVFMFI